MSEPTTPDFVLAFARATFEFSAIATLERGANPDIVPEPQLRLLARRIDRENLAVLKTSIFAQMHLDTNNHRTLPVAASSVVVDFERDAVWFLDGDNGEFTVGPANATRKIVKLDGIVAAIESLKNGTVNHVMGLNKRLDEEVQKIAGRTEYLTEPEKFAKDILTILEGIAGRKDK